MKFAHIADAHLGAFSTRSEVMLMNLESFEYAMDKCLEEEVDFVLISGDLFSSTHPNLDVVRRAVTKLARVRNSGVRIYVLLGSHDYDPTSTSMLHVLESTGLFTFIARYQREGEKLRLSPVKDEQTGAVIYGISGRTLSLDKGYYELLDRDWLAQQVETEERAIFAFHIGIKELLPEGIREFVGEQSIPLSLLPRGFKYYAGGHIHENIHHLSDNLGPVVYPGPTFGDSIEELMDPEPKGFYLVEMEGEPKARFVPCDTHPLVKEEFDLGEGAIKELSERMEESMSGISLKEGDSVLIKLCGKLTDAPAGKLKISKYRERMLRAGARVVWIHNTVKGRIGEETVYESRYEGMAQDQIERDIMSKSISSFKPLKILSGERGLALALEILNGTRGLERGESNKSDHENHITSLGYRMLGIFSDNGIDAWLNSEPKLPEGDIGAGEEVREGGKQEGDKGEDKPEGKEGGDEGSRKEENGEEGERKEDVKEVEVEDEDKESEREEDRDKGGEGEDRQKGENKKDEEKREGKEKEEEGKEGKEKREEQEEGEDRQKEEGKDKEEGGGGVEDRQGGEGKVQGDDDKELEQGEDGQKGENGQGGERQSGLFDF